MCRYLFLNSESALRREGRVGRIKRRALDSKLQATAPQAHTPQGEVSKATRVCQRRGPEKQQQ